jgi:hypothetical protein
MWVGLVVEDEVDAVDVDGRQCRCGHSLTIGEW